MYSFPYFKDHDPSSVIEFINQHPFAVIIGVNSNQQPEATQIPVFIEEREGKMYLSGHMMRKTDHQLALEKNNNVLCIFTSPHTYVSGTWYKNKATASTWNYMSVHIRGKLSFLNSEALVEVLRKTSLHFENNDAASATIFDNLPEEYTSGLMKAILAFEVEVEEVDHVFKLSQNRDEESYINIIEQLEKGDDGARYIAKEMKIRQENLFKGKL